MNVDFIFDFASPNAYLCHKAIQNLEKTHDIKFNYIPCLLGGIMKLSNNQPPMVTLADIPNKLKYEFDTAFNRFMKEHNITKFKMNEHFPVNTISLIRGAIVAQKNDFFESYVEIVLSGLWEQSLKLDTPEALHELLNNNDCYPDLVIEGIAKDEIKAELIANTSEAVEKGAFGIPTFFVENEMFYGKDSLRELKEMSS
ncbi:2-hydroxychromene-2-carboxylate isomerase [Gammaproteobacteria bacterium]|jgi:2-hydroxychromene-2-carboxylate isomerase|nr:2-hydroxychromene-2-carboxylate isomerase [Gammaproteobacteria bacterium]|tara:strand:- start:5566 stop:6162 length:597 start_codon:yes stop_codon:yes gene_type:complete